MVAIFLYTRSKQEVIGPYSTGEKARQFLLDHGFTFDKQLNTFVSSWATALVFEMQKPRESSILLELRKAGTRLADSNC